MKKYNIEPIKQMGEIKRIDEELEQAYLENIETLRYTVEARNPYIKEHSDRVSEYAVLIGQKYGLSQEELKTLRIGGLFHDIGKIGIPDQILLKDTTLTQDEYSQIKHHPSIGANILLNATQFKDIIPIIKYHHERYDGRGYPENLAGENIPLLARIITIADSFDAMSSRRIYRNNLELEQIINELERNKNTQFDPQLTDIFLDILNNFSEKIKEIQEKY